MLKISISPESLRHLEIDPIARDGAEGGNWAEY